MEIPPDQIRLTSRPSDPYVWPYHSFKEHLFSVSLSGGASVYRSCPESFAIQRRQRLLSGPESGMLVQAVLRARNRDFLNPMIHHRRIRNLMMTVLFVTQIHRVEDEKQQRRRNFKRSVRLSKTSGEKRRSSGPYSKSHFRTPPNGNLLLSIIKIRHMTPCMN